VAILVDRTRSPDEFTRVTALTWLRAFVALAGGGRGGLPLDVGGQCGTLQPISSSGGRLVPHFADILGAVLPCISHGENKGTVP
jgi:vacuole morphology and inheritance protein 14